MVESAPYAGGFVKNEDLTPFLFFVMNQIHIFGSETGDRINC
jgi:hypothetical protein